eukprot:CAMPEP_0118722578 /NCGR_PEP_ID=MMETSP0800-20121206/31497_1 /TAXON_ID=210618 ORGANISM="Striatella unipunctata, Strain CCMP2910" /NCGR_SAMPLE_ID=MMETSP0800 /ASSEMBLY_ACC=CAM_ASM_000638 /LENGTH=400 /DNA_ID=CAMNT_0006630851 /DNA_START=68 /DNA_END=1270 /DNA_ORIENTATION=-
MSVFVDATSSAVEHCEAMATLHADIAAEYRELSSLCSKKLWHQLTLKLLRFLSSVEFLRTTSEGTNSFLALYDKMVLAIDKKLNALHLVDGDAAKAILENLMEKKTRLGVSATLFLESKLGLLNLRLLAQGGADGLESPEAKTQLAQIHESIKSHAASLGELADDFVSAEVHSAHYECAMTYRKAVGPPEAFYKEAVSYLNYTPLESISITEQIELAKFLSLAALTGEGVFNFGQIVVSTPILSVLSTTSHSWLVDVMRASAKGNVKEFQKITQTHADAIAKEPALTSRASVVQEKITLLALIHLVFERDSSDRTLSFSEIAERIQVPRDQVEMVVMRALSLGLLEGSMDQVDETVTISWIMPRVLDGDQMKDLGRRFGEWAGKVEKTRDYMGEQTPTFA